MEFSKFLQEFAGHRNTELPEYGLQEHLCWIADVTVIEAFESGVLDLPDFYFTGDDYRYRFQSEAKQRFLDMLRGRFNSGVAYKGRAFKWDTVVEQKTAELSRYLFGRIGRLDSSEPSPNLHGTDERELRRRIQGLSQSEALRLGIGKSTLHYLRQRARNKAAFKAYERIREKLDS